MAWELPGAEKACKAFRQGFDSLPRLQYSAGYRVGQAIAKCGEPLQRPFWSGVWQGVFSTSKLMREERSRPMTVRRLEARLEEHREARVQAETAHLKDRDKLIDRGKDLAKAKRKIARLEKELSAATTEVAT